MNLDWIHPAMLGQLTSIPAWGLWVAAIGLLLTTLWWWVARPTRSTSTREPVTLAWSPRSDRALSSAEVAAYFRLREALPQHIILPQVQVSRFLRVTTRLSYTAWMRRVGARCVDFAICDESGVVIAVVELEAEPVGGSMGTGAAQRKQKVLKAADIPVLYWDRSHLPSSVHIRAMMMAAESGRAPAVPHRPSGDLAQPNARSGASGATPGIAQREDAYGLVGRRG